jgi:glyoxylase-like metal-dependent hydrolase (beta-lactamase superfamily II)
MNTYSFTIGEYDALILCDESAPRPASSFLTDVPQDALNSAAQSLGLNADALDFSRNVLVLRRKDQVIVVDTGMGAGRDGAFGKRLSEQGIMPEQVTLIIITHGHLDHIGGILADDGSFIYPNARYAISDAEWGYSTNDTLIAADTPPNTIWRALLADQRRVTRLNLSAGEAEIAPGITAIPAYGHTVGHIGLLIESNGDRLIHLVDAVHSSLQVVHPEWSPKFDYDKAQAADTRRALFARAAWEQLHTLIYHFPFPGLGKVSEQDGAFGWTPFTL